MIPSSLGKHTWYQKLNSRRVDAPSLLKYLEYAIKKKAASFKLRPSFLEFIHPLFIGIYKGFQKLLSIFHHIALLIK